jgi:hypothetical protein
MQATQTPAKQTPVEQSVPSATRSVSHVLSPVLQEAETQSDSRCAQPSSSLQPVAHAPSSQNSSSAQSVFSQHSAQTFVSQQWNPSQQGCESEQEASSGQQVPSTQSSPQRTPAVQVHSPCTQSKLASHGSSQFPQCAASVSVSTHVLPQQVNPVSQSASPSQRVPNVTQLPL